jgi:putative ABC transport system permease protein
MRLDQLIRRNVAQHRVSSGLTLLNVALGVALVGAVLLLRAATADTFLKPSRGFGLVVGAPGSTLELVLNTIFHVGQSPGLLDYGVLEELEANNSVQLAVPYAVGDAFRGYRVVGTSEAFFDPRFPYPSADSAEHKLAAGRPFHFDRAALQAELGAIAAGTALPGGGALASSGAQEAPTDEAVVGAEVARALDVQVGDQIEPTHGVDGAGVSHERPQLWRVVGVLKRTDTPIDRLVLINLDSFFRISDHKGGVIPETGKPGISAVVLFPKPGVHKALLLGQLNKRTQLQVADVDTEVHRLLGIIGNVDRVFLVIALLVVLVGVVSVAVAIYNTLAARARELSILRILGASRATLFGMLVGEAALLSAVGGALGLVLAHGLVFASAGLVEKSAGFRPRSAVFLPEELVVYLLVVLAGAAGGLLPAVRAYKNEAAARLAPLA